MYYIYKIKENLLSIVCHFIGHDYNSIENVKMCKRCGYIKINEDK